MFRVIAHMMLALRTSISNFAAALTNYCVLSLYEMAPIGENFDTGYVSWYREK